MKRVFIVAALCVCAQITRGSDALTFFNNWFVTGDYAVAGVGLRGTGVGGWASGNINMTGIPSNAEPIAAFLYWSTVETSATPGARVGYFDGSEIQATVMGNAQSQTPACASSGGGTAPTGTNAFVYRADVLRYMPVNTSNIRQANGTHTVKLPDAGSGGAGPLTNGVSLIVIYRIVVPGLPFIVPLRSIVIYNGAFTLTSHSVAMTQNVAGFYQASKIVAGKLTAIAANGQAKFSTPFSVNGATISTSPFDGALGTRWDNPTYGISLAQNASSFSTMAIASSTSCVTVSALVASVNVQDTDGDGLLDVWETKGLHRNTQVSPATFGGCSDYPSEACENLPAMGASPSKRDVFVQIDWMHGTGDGTGGVDRRGTHDHMPQLAALSSVASVFSTHAINLHFDVGANYQGAQSTCGNALCSFIIPAAYGKGGSDIDESTLVCHDTAAHKCNYQEPYPVLSFEFGFASVRDGNKDMGIGAHFAQDRKDLFRYSLFAHALAGPFNSTGQPVDPFTLQPASAPLSYSGIAHRPGGGLMVTLGLWRSDVPANDQVGSVQTQAGTYLHELGHNLGLGHAGLNTQPNCLPNYPSVMNYAYQTRGLTDAAGSEHYDFSYGVLLPLSENLLTQVIPMGLQAYRVRYYGPLAPNQPAAQAAQVHCDGTPIKPGEPDEVRLEGPTVSTPDWSNGTNNWKKTPIISSDVNYDGTKGQLFTDTPDWLILNLQQIGTGYSFGGLSVGVFATDGGVYATDGGVFATDAGVLATDGGVFATDGGVFATDGGVFATDGGVFATDGGVLATDGGALSTDAGELNQSTLILSGPPKVPNGSFTAVNTATSVVTNWLPPDTAMADHYNVYRCAIVSPATTCTPSLFKPAPGGTPTPTFTDTVNDFVDAGATCPATSTCYNTTYMYYVTVVSVVAGKPPAESGPSNTSTKEVTHLFVIADNQVVTYGTPYTAPPTFHVYGDVLSSLSGVSCSYVPTTPRNAGTYPISCSGPATTTATDRVTYNAPYLSFTPGALTIKPLPISILAVTDTKTYDGTTISAKLPGISRPLISPDTAVVSQAFDSKAAGPRTLIPSITISDGNGGMNYAVTLSGTPGTINTFTLTVTATGVNKSFDGTVTATVTLSDNHISGDIFTDSYASATFASANPGQSIAVAVTGISIAGQDAVNYTLTSTTATTTANISNSINLAALALNGENYTDPVNLTPAPPIVNGTTLQLTNATSETASAWLGTAIPVSSPFTTTFQFQITPASTGPNSIGDGFAFVIQGNGSGALGSTGMGAYIGYAGIPNSLAIEFDTYSNQTFGDPLSPHIAIQSLGMAANTSNHAAPGANFGGTATANFADGQAHTAKITYDGTSIINVYLDDLTTPVVTGTIPNLSTFLGLSNGLAYVGFTAATGAAQEASNILTWTWN